MAIHIQTLKIRALTAVIFVVVMLGGLLFHAYAFITLFILIAVGCSIEFFRLLRLIPPGKIWPRLLVVVPYILLPVFLMIDLGFYPERGFVFFSHNAISSSYNPLMPCAVIFSIWINDTMAYLVGSWIGKTPFSSISPKKTWEGTIGGALLSTLLIGAAGSWLNVSSALSAYHWFIIALICSVMGTLGDLFESKLKRLANVKDSGQIMPGHGGFLDRFDSLLIATPFVWLYVKLFC
jgi:phosphatidate cytidylyltransferase